MVCLSYRTESPFLYFFRQPLPFDFHHDGDKDDSNENDTNNEKDNVDLRYDTDGNNNIDTNNNIDKDDDNSLMRSDCYQDSDDDDCVYGDDRSDD